MSKWIPPGEEGPVSPPVVDPITMIIIMIVAGYGINIFTGFWLDLLVVVSQFVLICIIFVLMDVAKKYKVLAIVLWGAATYLTFFFPI